jgi:hypothetical protein
LLSNSDDGDRDGVKLYAVVRIQSGLRKMGVLWTYAERLEEILGLGVNLKLTGLALGEVESRDFWDVLILSLTLLFLELEGNTTDGSTLNTLHQVSGVASNLANPC